MRSQPSTERSRHVGKEKRATCSKAYLSRNADSLGVMRGWKLTRTFAAAVIYVMAVLIAHAAPYRDGDPVDMIIKLRDSKGHVALTQVLGRQGPRFAADVEFTLDLFNPQGLTRSGLKTDPQKVAFAFASDRFQTPWFELLNKNNEYPEHIEFDLVYSGTYVVELSTRIRYASEKPRSEPATAGQGDLATKPTILSFHWRPYTTTSSSFGFTVFLVLASLGLIAAAVFVIADVGKRRYYLMPGRVAKQ